MHKFKLFFFGIVWESNKFYVKMNTINNSFFFFGVWRGSANDLGSQIQIQKQIKKNTITIIMGAGVVYIVFICVCGNRCCGRIIIILNYLINGALIGFWRFGYWTNYRKHCVVLFSTDCECGITNWSNEQVQPCVYLQRLSIISMR